VYKFILKYLNACINLIKKVHGTSKNKNKGMREVACRSTPPCIDLDWQVGCELTLGGWVVDDVANLVLKATFLSFLTHSQTSKTSEN
jgi:hypothetical protein